MTDNNFAIYYTGDAYSTDKKIMGRQSAGKAFMRGVARTWPGSTLHGVGPQRQDGYAMAEQLKQDGWSGKLQWTDVPNWEALAGVGALYFPSPTARNISFSRNATNPAAFSVMGVTFTLSSAGAMDSLCELCLPPHKPWDALVCISQVAQDLARQMQDETRAWWAGQTGATRFNTPQLPVIPLGIDAPAFAPQPGQKAGARAALGLDGNETVFLFAGRLSFHGKANPAPMYQALEKAARHAPVVCVEAGLFFNEPIREGFRKARQALAPSVRFVWVDGNDPAAYRQAWQAADVFVSLSDNIQETFGLTPVEAMAAGLPVLVSDWNGYKDTVRDGIDGFRVPTVLPPAGAGVGLAVRHGLDLDSYDFYIGRSSLATVVDPVRLAEATIRLATDSELRARMGAAALARAHGEYDWPVILRRYTRLAAELGEIRRAAGPQPPEPWIGRTDPFARFAHFSSGTLAGNWLVKAQPGACARLDELTGLAMLDYGFDSGLLPRQAVVDLLAVASRTDGQSVNAVLTAAGATGAQGVRALMWLWKFDLVQVCAV